jgi:hypothetical protein
LNLISYYNPIIAPVPDQNPTSVPSWDVHRGGCLDKPGRAN